MTSRRGGLGRGLDAIIPNLNPIPLGVEIVGIEAVVLDRVGGDLIVRLALSDGSTGATHWPLAQLREFVGVVAMARAPLDATIN